MKKYLSTICVSIFIGIFFLFLLMNDKDYMVSNTDNIFYIFQTGVYENVDNIKSTDGIIIKDNDLYRIYNAILSNEELVNIYKDKFTLEKTDYFIRTISLNKNISTKIKSLENKMLESNKDEMIEINKEILSLYKEYYDKGNAK